MATVTEAGRLGIDVLEGDNFTNDRGETSALSPLVFRGVGRYAARGGNVMRPHAPVLGSVVLQFNREFPPIVSGSAGPVGGERQELPPADNIG